MSAADGDMDWEPIPHASTSTPAAAYITVLPFDVSLELVKNLDVVDTIQLRLTCRALYELCSTSSVWMILAENMTQRRPIPLPPFRTRSSLTCSELRTAVCRAARLERNWLSSFGRLRVPPRVLHEPGRTHGDILVIIPGGRHLVTGASSSRGEGIGGVLRVWDLTTGDRLASFDVRPEDVVLQWRPVEEGRAVMFLVRDGILSTGTQHYHLLRLEFTEGVYSTQASFIHHSSLTQELPVADTSLSEDVVIVLAIDSDYTITMFILQWRHGTMVSVKTDVKPPDHPYFAILSLNDLSIWVDSPSAPRTYSFPLSAIYPHLSYPPKSPIFLRQSTPTVLNHISNPSAPPGYTPLYRDTTRKWAMGSESSLLSRPLSILHIASRHDEDTEKIYICLSHEYLPTEFTSSPTDRAHFAPLSIVTTPVTNPNGEVTEVPIIAAESANVIFPELLPSGETQMRVITLPPDDPAQRHNHPQWYNDHLMRPLETPPELNLTRVVLMSLDDATGVLAIAVEGGDISWT
ncbi:hypothetical protein JB92DRAFT_2982228 [Gautieria morchelliformis]|nr:hypothetical protein JB92DRAFT_2982228 [Gautieria morchelliformis]